MRSHVSAEPFPLKLFFALATALMAGCSSAGPPGDPPAFVCSDPGPPLDLCASDFDCEEGTQCTLTNNRRVCQPPMCAFAEKRIHPERARVDSLP